MLLPIGHENMTVRRMPFVTIGLIVVTTVLFALAALAGLDEMAASFGYIPEHRNYLGLVTHLFVHGGVWHLVGNMWFLFLAGLALEDRWGRVPFVLFYVGAGVIAGIAHHLATSDRTAALIGASGAVAGAMGAFLVLFGATKIRFVGFFRFRPTTFVAPAYVMLPLWLGVELLYGMASPSSGTAHWAHVGGFAFGALIAGTFRIFGLDRRLDDAVERAAVLGDDPRIDTAKELIAKGDAAQAVVLLEGLAKEKPDSSHVKDALTAARRAAPNGGRSFPSQNGPRSFSAPAPAPHPPPSTPAAAPFFPPPAPK